MMESTPVESGRLLIVDDTPENIEILGELLEEYKVFFTLDGEKALEKARIDPQPDLILLDVMMPGMDGFEVCQLLKADESTKHIPIIFVTALGDSTDETRGLELGAVDYVTKPFSPAVVKSRVRMHLELQRARRALANQNQLLEVTVSERTRQLRGAFDRIRHSSHETIVRLSRAAEFKDDDTGAHVLRMSHYAEAIARQLGLPAKECEDLLHAAPMHDVGKIGIPDRILLKPGKLDSEEWQIMRRHCKMGADILAGSDSDVIALGEVVALTHHEKWDGSGYPRQLSGEDIPIVGRITAIADVFDALTSKRPYKEPFSLEKSFRIIREGRGNHFDPAVVDAFFAVEKTILAIKDRYQDNTVSHLFQVADPPN